MYFWNYKLQKTQLDKCLKGAALQYLLTSNMVNAPEHCWNLNNDKFTRFIDHCEVN